MFTIHYCYQFPSPPPSPPVATNTTLVSVPVLTFSRCFALVAQVFMYRTPLSCFRGHCFFYVMGSCSTGLCMGIKRKSGETGQHTGCFIKDASCRLGWCCSGSVVNFIVILTAFGMTRPLVNLSVLIQTVALEAGNYGRELYIKKDKCTCLVLKKKSCLKEIFFYFPLYLKNEICKCKLL